MSNRYVWHGLSRAAGAVLQPSAAVGVRHGGLTLDGGWVGHYELDEVQAGELSETGIGNRTLGEDDLWARGGLRLGSFQLHAGVVHYRFHGTEAAGGVGTARNTTEIYGAFSATSLYLNPTLEYWHDVDRVRGAFLRASASLPLLGWPYPPYVFLFIDGDVGVNLGQGPDPAHPRQLANFADRGLTHTSLGVTADLRSFHWAPWAKGTIALGLRSQLNFDEATRADGAGRQADLVFWAWTGVTVVLGGEARRLQ
jgi:hypothetical protein